MVSRYSSIYGIDTMCELHNVIYFRTRVYIMTIFLINVETLTLIYMLAHLSNKHNIYTLSPMFRLVDLKIDEFTISILTNTPLS
jgi:hypothetical protein